MDDLSSLNPNSVSYYQPIQTDVEGLSHGVSVKYEYRHTYIESVPSELAFGLGGRNVNSKWTNLMAHEYARKHDVSIVATSIRDAQ
jgi:hypothetical protein